MFSYQKTIKHKVSCYGVGLHSGQDVRMSLLPVDEVDYGIVFKRVDIEGKNNLVKAQYDLVTETTLGTTICNEDGVKVATIEHLMAALWGCGIDNCLIEINGPEVPIMDGSSEPFVFLIECAGRSEQGKTRHIIEILKEIRVEDDQAKGGYISISPAESFSVNLEIDFGDQVIACQKGEFDSRAVSFKSDLCRARTFGFEHEVSYLQSQGLAKGGSLDNAIVVGKDGILNEGELRYGDEFVRHKILDCIGDIYLAGGYFKGKLSGYKSGHALNNKLLRALFSDKDAWRTMQYTKAAVAS